MHTLEKILYIQSYYIFHLKFLGCTFSQIIVHISYMQNVAAFYYMKLQNLKNKGSIAIGAQLQ